MNLRRLPLLGILLLLSLRPAAAATHTILVAPRDSPAAAAAEAKASPPAVTVERSLQRALDQAAVLMKTPGDSVDILLAGGDYEGKAGAGVWGVAPIVNPTGVLRIAGGYDASFGERQPFRHLTRLITVPGRGGPFIKFERGTKLKELVISGLVLDSAPSNTYDQKSNSILKGQSRTFPLLAFGLMTTDHLVVADNVFLNGPHGTIDPYITAASPDTVVDIQNNFFINNIKAMQMGPPVPLRFPIKQINLRHNTFLSNWPYNPEATSSNVGAVELYHNASCKQFNIEGNIFANNPGGAFQHDWPENRMPAIAMRNNLFFRNATLFGNNEDGAGVIAGKFGTNPRYLVLKLQTIEDDFNYKVEGNAVMDPGLPLKQLLVVEAGNGDDVNLSGYAPKMEFDLKAPPFPTNPAAKKYGVQPSQAYPVR